MTRAVKINGGHWTWEIIEGRSTYNGRVIAHVDLTNYDKKRHIILKDENDEEIAFIILRCKSDTIEVKYLKE